MGCKKVRCDIRCSKNLDFGVFGLYLCLRRSQAAPQHNFAPETDEKTIFLIDSHSAFFEILIPQKVRQEGLSDTHACRCCSIRQSMYVWDFSAFVWQTKNSSTEPTWVVQWNCMKFGNSQD